MRDELIFKIWKLIQHNQMTERSFDKEYQYMSNQMINYITKTATPKMLIDANGRLDTVELPQVQVMKIQLREYVYNKYPSLNPEIRDFDRISMIYNVRILTPDKLSISAINSRLILFKDYLLYYLDSGYNAISFDEWLLVNRFNNLVTIKFN